MKWNRAQSAMWWARSLLTIAGLAITVAVFRFIAAPVGPTPMFGGSEPTVLEIPISLLTTAVGVAGLLVGLAWMWRIYRGPTKSDTARWRYRDR